MKFFRFVAGFVVEGAPQSSARLLAVVAAIACAVLTIVLSSIVINTVVIVLVYTRRPDLTIIPQLCAPLNRALYVMGPLTGVALALRRSSPPDQTPPDPLHSLDDHHDDHDAGQRS